jgi:beta-lactamase class C
MLLHALSAAIAALCIGVLLPADGQASDNERDSIVSNGQSYVFNYGTASRATGKPINDDTLFEIGSVSKTFTATLASYAEVDGKLSLADPVSKYLPALRGSHFGEVSLLSLGTHTPGGMPLQVPDEVTNDDQLMRYFQNWKPTFAPGTYRTYANPSIGLLGRVAAKSLNEGFGALMEGKLYPVLGLKDTYLNIPTSRLDDYAQGYTTKDAPIRMAPGVLMAETYGVRTTAGDLVRFVEANMGMIALDEKWQRAITNTHTGYYRVGGMTQDLIWEQYSYPVELKTLLAGQFGRPHPQTQSRDQA